MDFEGFTRFLKSKILISSFSCFLRVFDEKPHYEPIGVIMLTHDRFISKSHFSGHSGSELEGQKLKNPKTRSFKHILAIASKKSLKINMQFLSTFLDIFTSQNSILFAMLFR